MHMDSHPMHQNEGLHHAARQPQQEVTKPKAKIKTTSPKKSGVDGGSNQVPTYLGMTKMLRLSIEGLNRARGQ